MKTVGQHIKFRQAELEEHRFLAALQCATTEELRIVLQLVLESAGRVFYECVTGATDRGAAIEMVDRGYAAIGAMFDALDSELALPRRLAS